MRSKFSVLVLVAVIAAAVIFFGRQTGTKDRSVTGLPDPVQTPASGSTVISLSDCDVQVDFKYNYEIKALAVHTMNYHGSGVFDRICPRDVAFAWGSVAEYNDRIDFHWDQSGRWYYWMVAPGVDISPVGNSAGISAHSANNHLIPADDNIEGLIKKIKTGDVVTITGYLVNIRAETADGKIYTNSSSTTRTDTGDGACEIIYVTNIQWS